MRTTWIWMAAVSSLALASCTQQAAPVVSGYEEQGVALTDYARKTPYTLKAMRDVNEEKRVLAARPVPQKNIAVRDDRPVIDEAALADISPAAGGRVVTAMASVPSVEEEVRPVFSPIEVTGDGTYRVEEKDTLYKIARAHNVTARDLMVANDLDSTAAVLPGMVLRVPRADAAPVMARRTVPSVVTSVNKAEAALARLEGKAEPRAPEPSRVVATLDTETETKLEAAASRVEPAAGKLPTTSMTTAKTTDSGVGYVEHRVAAGETVYRISQNYKSSVIDIMALNDLQTPQDLKAGTMIKVPAGSGGNTSYDETAPAFEKAEVPQTVSPYAQDTAKIEATAETKVDAVVAEQERITLMQKGRIDPLAAKSKGLAWPVKGKIIRKYGDQGAGVAHTGINIAVPENTPVLAAENGNVIYAGNGLKTYGNLVLIRHADGMVTAYGHNAKLLVAKGETIKKGQVVALSGKTGNVEVPQVHFEIRKAAKAVDPLRVLAGR